MNELPAIVGFILIGIFFLGVIIIFVAWPRARINRYSHYLVWIGCAGTLLVIVQETVWSHFLS